MALDSTMLSNYQQDAMTPQQKLAIALMSQQQPTNNQGQYSPLQGMGQLANGAMAGYMMGQGQQQPQQNMAQNALGLGAQQGSVGPTNYNAALMAGGNPAAFNGTPPPQMPPPPQQPGLFGMGSGGQ